MASALTACTSTAVPSAMIKTVSVPVMPQPPTALLYIPRKPAPPAAGDAQTLLMHAADFGAYVSELESQNAAWRAWSVSGSMP